MKNGHQLLYCGRAQANTKNIIPMDPENAKPIRAAVLMMRWGWNNEKEK